MEKVTNFVIEQIKNRCSEFLSEEQYSKLADSSKNKILESKYNVQSELKILEKKARDINKTIDKLFEDKYKGLFEDEDFTRVYSKQIETRKGIEERIKQLEKMQEKEESSIDINKFVKDFINMKEITRTMLVSLVDKIEISENKEITIYYKFNILNMRKLEDEIEKVS